MLNDSIVEDAALIMPGASFTPASPSGRGESQGHPAVEPGHPRGGEGNDPEFPDNWICREHSMSDEPLPQSEIILY